MGMELTANMALKPAMRLPLFDRMSNPEYTVGSWISQSLLYALQVLFSIDLSIDLRNLMSQTFVNRSDYQNDVWREIQG
jgi:hypothetical protein